MSEEMHRYTKYINQQYIACLLQSSLDYLIAIGFAFNHPTGVYFAIMTR